MPVKQCQIEGKPGFRWDDQGKCYTYNPNSGLERDKAKQKALQQGIAISSKKPKSIGEGIVLSEDSYTDYPQYIKDNAAKGIRLNEAVNNKCATQVGKVRAQQLAQGKPISRETIQRMFSYLSRAMEYFNPNDNEACGTISVYLWGGPEALDWAQRKLEQINKENFSCSCGRGLEDHINEIKYDFSLTPEQKEKKIEDLTSYNDFIEGIERNFDFDSIGKTYETKESSLVHFHHIPIKELTFRVINLYKYEPQPGYSPIQPNSRRFCSQLYLRTRNQDDYLRFDEVQSLVNPGARYGINDILRYCGNFTTDPEYTTCRHRWIRYKYDTSTGNIVRDPSQPPYTPTISNR